MSVRKLATIVVGVVILVAVVLVFRSCHRRPPLDPDAIAKSETRMWKAYYSGDKLHLGLELVSMLRSQYGLSLLEAKRVGELLAASSMTFGSSSSGYEASVLPGLVEAYGLLRDISGLKFDPKAAARAELGWWVARRTPGEDSPEQVGERIAELYTILYGKDLDCFHEAGLLRAQAAELRDSGGLNADWARVEKLLQQSYRVLAEGINQTESA